MAIDKGNIELETCRLHQGSLASQEHINHVFTEAKFNAQFPLFKLNPLFITSFVETARTSQVFFYQYSLYLLN